MDIIDRDVNTRSEAIRWAADMMIEIKANRARIAHLEQVILAAYQAWKDHDDHEVMMVLKQAEWDIGVMRAKSKHAPAK